jgi:hypothetical protein
MRRLLFALTFAVVSGLALVGGATGTHSDGNGPKKDLVAGTGRLICCQQPQVHVNAYRDKMTNEVRGHFYIRYPSTALGGGFDMRGPVVCVSTTLSHAGLVGRIERTNGVQPFVDGAGFVEGNFVSIEIRDLGEPGTADGANFHPGQSNQPTTCPPGVDEPPISQGNYVVHSDPPLSVLSALDVLLAQFEAAAQCPYGKTD